mgnify:FL=1
MTALRNDTLAQFLDLRKLLLGSNDISSIDDDAFQSQRLLNALDLSSNRITEVRATHLAQGPFRCDCG